MARPSKNNSETVLGSSEKSDDRPSMDASAIVGRRVNQLQLAALLGYNRGTIAAWQERDCPCVMVGDKRLYDVAAVVKWLRAEDVKTALAKYQSEDGETPEGVSKARRQKWLAIEQEADTRERLRALISVQYVYDQVSKDYAEVLASLSKIPDILAANVEASIAAHVRKIADKHVRSALQALHVKMVDDTSVSER